MSSELQDHINSEVQSDIKQLYKHADIANAEMGAIKVTLEGLLSDMGWLKNFFWVIATASIGGLITSVLNLVWK